MSSVELISEQWRNGALVQKGFGEAFYIVTAYGMLGLGTDETSKLQAIVNDANAKGRTAIFFPHGTYYVTGITGDENMYYFGDNATFIGGYAKTIFQIGSGQSNLITNVKDYGAKGDLVTNDTASIQLAINATASGGTVFFPPGDYLIQKVGTRVLSYSGETHGYGLLLSSKSNVKLEFSLGAKIIMDVTDANLFNAIWAVNCTNIVMENVSVKGIGARTTKLLETGIGISIENSKNVFITGCRFENIRGGARAYLSQNVLIFNCFSSVTANEQSSAHFALYRCQNSDIDRCTSYGATQDGDMFIYGGDSKNCNITNCKAHSYTYGDASKTIWFSIAQGVMVDSSGVNCKIIDCYAYGYYFAFDIKNASEGCEIRGCTAEKSKFSFSARKGDSPTLSPVNIVNITGNIAIPNGGNGNSNSYLGMTVPVAYCIEDCYGGDLSGNTLYNSVSNQGISDFIGMVIVLSDNVGEANQGGINISNNKFRLENRLGTGWGVSQKQALRVITSHTLLRISIVDNNFDTPQDGMTTNLIEISNVQGLKISGNSMATTNTTGFPLIKLTNCSIVNVNDNNIGFHYGVMEAFGCKGISFNNNVTGESINVTPTPTVLFDNCQYVNVHGNTQYPYSDLNRDAEYYKDLNGTNFVSMQGNTMFLKNKGATDYYTTVATSSIFLNNMID